MSKRYFAGISGAGGKPRAVLCIYLFNVFFFVLCLTTTAPHAHIRSTAAPRGVIRIRIHVERASAVLTLLTGDGDVYGSYIPLFSGRGVMFYRFRVGVIKRTVTVLNAINF